MDDDVLFVRELAAGRDLVLAFGSDGSPAWALDLESGLQWWYPGGDRPAVRHAIAQSWDGFATMPVVATSYAGPHPALELGRRAERSMQVPPPPTRRPGPPWADRLYGISRGLPLALRLAAGAGALLIVLAVAPAVLGFLFGAGGGAAHAVQDQSTTPPPVATAGDPCPVLGETSHDPTGRVLVCVTPSRALSWELVWHPAS